MRRNIVETVIGALVLVVAAMFVVFAFTTTSHRAAGGYEVMARFDRVDGVQTGSEIRLSGIRVGTVSSVSLDPQTYLAVVRLNLDNNIQLPTDTVAEIVSDGLLGNRYLALVPGGSDNVIPPGGEIQYTQSPVSLEALIGRFMFGQGQEGGQAAPAQGGTGALQAPNPLAPPSLN